MSDDIGLDKVLRHVGDFGGRQVLTFSLIFLITIFYGACHMAYVFTAMETENRCFIPGCDEQEPEFKGSFIDYTIPSDKNGKPKKCEMYSPKNNTKSTLVCTAENFKTDEARLCESFVFKYDGNSMAKEYDLLCENDVWKLSLVGSINTLGMLLGIWVTGYISDSYGRKPVLLFGMALGGIVGVSKSFAPNLQLFLLLEFLEAFIISGVHGSVFILAMELVIPEHRLWIGCVFFCFSSSGQMFLAAVSWIVKDWRFIIYIIYGPCIFFSLLYPLIMESLRWQLSMGDIDKVQNMINKITKSNGKTIPSSYFNVLQRRSIEKNNKAQQISFLEMIKSRRLLMRLIISAVIWIVCALLFYGLSLSSMSLAGNDYLNFLLISFIEIPAYILMALIAENIRRKTLLVGSFLLTSFSCIIFIFSGSGSGWFLLFLHSFGKFGATAAFNMVYLMTSEMFPTPLRHTTMGLCSMIGRIGSLVSPQIALLGIVWPPLPNVIFASTACVAGLLSLLLPETMGVKLPDTIEEAVIIGREMRSVVVNEEEQENEYAAQISALTCSKDSIT